MTQAAETVYVIRRYNGKYFLGCGYGGPGQPVPYWGEDIAEAKPYRTVKGAKKAAGTWGGHVGKAEITLNRIRWAGFLVWQLGEWRTVDADPRDFDPRDYEGNNGPLKSDNVDGFEDRRDRHVQGTD